MENTIRIKQYTEKCETEWDAFIEASINGTFLQSRRFLNYHGNKFNDESLMFYRNEKLVCVCPACRIINDRQEIFWSHIGSTFGGLVFSKDEYKAEKVIEIIKALKGYLNENNIFSAYLKITPDLFSIYNSDLLQYCLWYEGFSHYSEISTYVDLTDCGNDCASIFNRTHRRQRNNWQNSNAQFIELTTEKQIFDFHKLLMENLQVRNATPIHTPEEFIDFKFTRLSNEAVFYGIFLDNEMVAGCLLFRFFKANIMHMQNVAMKQEFYDGHKSPTAFAYYSMLTAAREQGFMKVSWGTSTFDQGRILNESLIRFKESVGSRHSMNRTYFWTR